MLYEMREFFLVGAGMWFGNGNQKPIPEHLYLVSRDVTSVWIVWGLGLTRLFDQPTK